MALHLTAEGLRRDASRVKTEALTPAGAAAATALMSHSIVNSLDGAKRSVVGLGIAAGGAYLAARGTGKWLPYMGVGAALGTVWAVFDKRDDRRF